MLTKVEAHHAPRTLTDQETSNVGGGTRGSTSLPLNPPSSQIGFTTSSQQFCRFQRECEWFTIGIFGGIF